MTASQRVEPGAGDAAKGPEGLSQFLGKVLDQLSLTSWMPSAMLVGVGAIVLQLHSHNNNDIAAAAQTLASKTLGTIIILTFALILGAVITQAFSFEAIRLLEGYWGGTWLSALLLKPWVGFRRHRLHAMRKKVQRQKEAAFQAGRTRMLTDMDREHLEILEDDVFGTPTANRRPHDAATVAAARAAGWRWSSSPALLDALDRSIARQGDYPAEHRLLPTRLGNVLRATEDDIADDVGQVEGLVMRRYDSIPPRLMVQHDQFRNRLEMYCCLVLVFGVLAVGSAWLLARPKEHYISAAGAFVILSLLGLVSYRAAIASARGYCTVLRTIVAEDTRHTTGA
jgi:hypothetical protein